MKTIFLTCRLCLTAFVFTLSGCGPADSTLDPKDMRISKHTVVKKVCLDGVSYYATEITDGIGSTARRTYLVIGGPVYTRGSSTPVACEK